MPGTPAPRAATGRPPWCGRRGDEAATFGRLGPAVEERDQDFPYMPGSMLVVLRRNVRHAGRRSRARGDGRTPNEII